MVLKSLYTVFRPPPTKIPGQGNSWDLTKEWSLP
jgi:hypothetical protein